MIGLRPLNMSLRRNSYKLLFLQPSIGLLYTYCMNWHPQEKIDRLYMYCMLMILCQHIFLLGIGYILKPKKPLMMRLCLLDMEDSQWPLMKPWNIDLEDKKRILLILLQNICLQDNFDMFLSL